MKIGILTFHFSYNYGALFQAYGLRSYLIEQGHEVEFINYQPEYLEAGGEIQFSNLFSRATLKIIYLKLVKLKEKLLGNKEREQYFSEFKKNYLGLDDSKVYKTLQELEGANLSYDLIITGSDQVWNPSDQHGVDPVYFLDFKTVNPNVKKISYAPSFGKDSLDKKYEVEIANLISKLDSVSIREKSGLKIIENLTSVHPTLVPDPTVLVSDYQKIMNQYNVDTKDYIFCYYLRSREIIGDVAEYIADKEDLKIYSPHNPHRRWKEIGETVYPGPREWLYLLNNSKLVITNSFHGTMLSILLNKPFIVVGIGSGERSKYNERAMNILNQCGLGNRFLDTYDEECIDKLKAEEIDWDRVNSKINVLRNEAKSYLNNSMGSE